MKIETLKELIGSNIGEITLSVEACYPMKTGASNGKPWARQDLKCSDDTGDIKVSVWNHEELPQTIKGTQVKFKGVPSKRGSGVVGVKVIENEYNGVKSVQLKVDDAGIIITQTGSVGSKSLDTGYDKKQTVQNSVQTVEADKDVHEPMFKKKFDENFPSSIIKPVKTDPSAKVGQYKELYKLCLTNADDIKHIGFNNEDYRQIATAFWIQGMRDGLHLQMTIKPDVEDEDSIPY